MPIGPSADGKHWVNINNECTDCKKSMPLPEMEGKHCPDCGTYQPTYLELQERYQAESTAGIDKSCPGCGASDQISTFCMECGVNLEAAR